jgi:hypothetical protein
LTTVEREVRELDKDLPLVGISTVSQILHGALWAPRMGASLLAIFGGLALILALAAARLVSNLLFGVSPTDWVAFGAACLVLGLVALVANLFPARRATAVDPTVALRYE